MTRVLDVAASALGLVLLSPILLLLAVAVKVSSPGPVLHRAVRAGRNDQPFVLLKFRSMGVNQSGPAITRAEDPRVTAVGRFLRRMKLDELPQLFNVLRGDMSLVGPRPEDPRYVALYDPNQRRVLAHRPGMTSPASLLYRTEEEKLRGEDWERTYVERVMPDKLRLDLAYLERRSVWSDVGVILQTLRSLWS